MRASDLARQEAEEEEDVWAKEFDDGSCSSEDCDEYGVLLEEEEKDDILICNVTHP